MKSQSLSSLGLSLTLNLLKVNLVIVSKYASAGTL